jgi:hypothetical protein
MSKRNREMQAGRQGSRDDQREREPQDPGRQRPQRQPGQREQDDDQDDDEQQDDR